MSFWVSNTLGGSSNAGLSPPLGCGVPRAHNILAPVPRPLPTAQGVCRWGGGAAVKPQEAVKRSLALVNY